MLFSFFSLDKLLPKKKVASNLKSIFVLFFVPQEV